MPEHDTTGRRDGAGKALRRRGILAAAGAAMAGILAKQAAAPVRAGTSLVIGNNMFPDGQNSQWVGNITNAGLLDISNTPADRGHAITAASSHGFGISAGTSSLTDSFGTPLAGVFGSGPGMGVQGINNGANAGIGVQGQSINGTGVQGRIFVTSSVANTTAVQGLNESSGSGGAGIAGLIPSGSTAPNTTAVLGLNHSGGANSNGVYGYSTTGYGVLGYSTGGAASISGISTNINIPAFAGGTSVQNGLAAHFTGTVYVDCATEGGQFVVNPMAAKNGLLKHPDGTHRLMYCMEAPESWAEDFGTGALTAGNAEVKLDPDFAALIEPDYHVFVTPRDAACRGLAVAAQRADGFTVRELNGGASSGAFSYRVVARPKSDRKVERLAKFAIPHVTYPDPSALTKPPAPTKRP